MVKAPHFDWAPSPKILFGPGSLNKLPALSATYGKNILVITGSTSFSRSSRWEKLQKKLLTEKFEMSHASIPREPFPQLVDDIVSSHRKSGIQVLVAIGGGSVLDAGKAISAMLKHEEGVKNYLEGVGDKQPHGSKVPFIAIPTTSGTGSEATKNAVLSEVGPSGYKKSLRHENFVPDVAIVDPELMLSCPPELTASSGMDAFTQLLEAYVSTKSSGMSDALAWEGLQYVAKGLEMAYDQGSNLEARSYMAYAALLSGISLANAGLGMVHGFASSVGARVDIPHGSLCGTLMGVANRITLKKLLDSDPYSEVVKKYAGVGKLFSEEENRYGIYYAQALIDKIEDLVHKFDLPGLSQFGLKDTDIPVIVQHTSPKNHPIPLTQGEMESILRHRI